MQTETHPWRTPTHLQNKHVTLEPLSPDHAADLIRAAESPRTFTYYSRLPDPFTADGMRTFINFLRGPANTNPFAVIDRAASTPVGITTFLDIRPEHGSLEIGWTWYAPSSRGTLINPSCKLLMMTHAFETLSAHRVAFRTDARNTASRRGIEKLGAHYEGLFREHIIMPDAHRRSSVYYSILKPQWPEVKTKLQERLANPNRTGEHVND